MNIYLVALIGLLVILATGTVVFRFMHGSSDKVTRVPLDSGRFISAGISMYLIALGFTYLYQHVDLDSTGLTKGVMLGLLTGIPFFAIPLFIDGRHLNKELSASWVVIGNWVASFILLGAVVGLLLG